VASFVCKFSSLVLPSCIGFQYGIRLRDTGLVAWGNSSVNTFVRLSMRTLPLAVALLLVACTEDVAQQAQEVIRPVRAIKVADASTFQERWFSGTAKGTQEIDLSFRVSGPLISRNVDVGSKVKEGDLIAQIDPATFRADLDEAKADPPPTSMMPHYRMCHRGSSRVCFW